MVNIDVMTYCSGYEPFIFERFIGSLYDTGFSGNVYIIGQENDSKIVQELQKKYNNIRFFNDTFSLPAHKLDVPWYRKNKLTADILSTEQFQIFLDFI